jgi:hypothetical protein
VNLTVATFTHDLRITAQASGLSCECSLDLIGSQLWGADDGSLAAMRSARDERLADTSAGQSWIALLERHDAELVQIASRDDAFKHVVEGLITLAGRILGAEEFDFARGNADSSAQLR